MANDTTTSTQTTHTEHTPTPTHTKTTRAPATEENRWVARLEEILQVKNVDELKSELTKLAGEVQTEIQNFDIKEHLSPEAKSRLKSLEKRYNEVVRAVHKAQKEFDREFNKSLRTLKSTRQEAEKQLNAIKNKITKHQTTIVKASKNLGAKIKKKTGKSAGRKTKKSGAARKTVKAKA
jgi:hypothetical protein